MRRITVQIATALITFIVGISAAGTWSLFSNNPTPEIAGANNHRAEQEILAIMRQYDVAQTRLDASFFEQIEADNFTVTLRSGRTLTKAQVIAFMKTWDGKTKFAHEDLHVQFYGDAAIVTGWMTATDMVEGNQYFRRWKSIYLFIKLDGRWQILSTTQVS